jgi:hypothetical protein
MDIEQEIIAELSIELQGEPTFNADILAVKVKNAIREVRKARNYPKSYTEENIQEDLQDYYSNIRNIALYDYNQIGAEFQSSASENSVSRSWVDRDKLFDGVYAFVKVL